MDLYNMVNLINMIEALKSGGKITDVVYNGEKSIVVAVDCCSYQFEMK